jgi:hypothetical protein
MSTVYMLYCSNWCGASIPSQWAVGSFPKFFFRICLLGPFSICTILSQGPPKLTQKYWLVFSESGLVFLWQRPLLTYVKLPCFFRVFSNWGNGPGLVPPTSTRLPQARMPSWVRQLPPAEDFPTEELGNECPSVLKGVVANAPQHSLHKIRNSALWCLRCLLDIQLEMLSHHLDIN